MLVSWLRRKADGRHYARICGRIQVRLRVNIGAGALRSEVQS